MYRGLHYVKVIFKGSVNRKVVANIVTSRFVICIKNCHCIDLDHIILSKI